MITMRVAPGFFDRRLTRFTAMEPFEVLLFQWTIAPSIHTQNPARQTLDAGPSNIYPALSSG